MITNCNCFLFKYEFFVVLFKIIYNNCAFCYIFCPKITVFPVFSTSVFGVFLNIFPFFHSALRKKAPFLATQKKDAQPMKNTAVRTEIYLSF